MHIWLRIGPNSPRTTFRPTGLSYAANPAAATRLPFPRIAGGWYSAPPFRRTGLTRIQPGTAANESFNPEPSARAIFDLAASLAVGSGLNDFGRGQHKERCVMDRLRILPVWLLI